MSCTRHSHSLEYSTRACANRMPNMLHDQPWDQQQVRLYKSYHTQVKLFREVYLSFCITYCPIFINFYQFLSIFIIPDSPCPISKISIKSAPFRYPYKGKTSLQSTIPVWCQYALVYLCSTPVQYLYPVPAYLYLYPHDTYTTITRSILSNYSVSCYRFLFSLPFAPPPIQ